MTVNEFRKAVKQRWPHVKVTIRTVSFSDLARAVRLCLKVSNERKGELPEINALAREAGIVPDGNVRFYEG